MNQTTTTLYSGADNTSQAVAQEAARTWERIAHQLAPIIGDGGFRALYARSLHLTRATYPWLIPTPESEHTASPFSGLMGSLQRREVVDARDASNTLLATFSELLATFIGKGLTTRLLDAARVDDGPGPREVRT